MESTPYAITMFILCPSCQITSYSMIVSEVFGKSFMNRLMFR